MDPINIIIGLNVIATFGANIGGAKKGIRSTVAQAKDKPKTYLQKLPLILSTLTLIALILAVFQIGTLEYQPEHMTVRIIGLLIYLSFSWFQIWSYKTLGENYSQELIIFKKHSLVKKGPFRYIRHPQYLAQILIDLGAAAAVFSYVLLPLALVEIPFLIMRAKAEEKMMARHFGADYIEYKKQTGFFIPFAG